MRPTSIPVLLDRLSYRYPSSLVDSVVEHVPGDRVVAARNITIHEEFFQGHFPGAPVLPGVLMIETLAQAAALLLLHDDHRQPTVRAVLRGVNGAKFRRQVVPGDRIRVEVTRKPGRGRVARVHGEAFVSDQLVVEADLLMAIVQDDVSIDPSATVHPDARIGSGSVIGRYVTIGPRVTLGRNCRVGPSTVVDGWTEIGDDNDISPFVSIGLPPQDLKYQGEETRVVIGDRNVIREFVTIHRGTVGGGGITRIGDRNLFMAYAHVAHDCHVGSQIIFANNATLGGHVHVEDCATISALSGVHQFCRVGRHAFIGAHSAVTKDAMPYAKTVGNRARIYGLNSIGLARRGFSPETINKLKRAYRYLLVSKLNTSRAVSRIEADPSLQCPEVRYLIDFIRSSHRGVLLRRPTRRADSEVVADE
ncbi:MAG TPA: acyl-ACP--UDP-N-acetylglucosamine O-acyltransferase [Vicinamibacterales bacterium]|nr:acyl-ACP--UDP-N-acetylglucosamine O-acyltransferase [Vicinamibacterales bacterium]